MRNAAKRAAWLEALATHGRAAELHEKAAGLFDRLGHPAEARRARATAAGERAARRIALAEHPDWTP
jgi:hypothetical protein